MTYRTIVCSLDGALSMSDGLISDVTATALWKAGGRRRSLLVTSSRPVSSMRQVVSRGGLSGAGLVLVGCRGAHVAEADSGTTLIKTSLPLETARAVVEAARGVRGMLPLWYVDGGILCESPEDDRAAQAAARDGLDLVGVWDLGEQPTAPTKVSLRCGQVPSRPVMERLRAACGKTGRLWSSGTGELEVTAMCASPLRALQRWCGYTGTPKEAILAFGASSEDIEVMAAAGLGVAMGDAPEQVRSAAGAVARTCADDGVAATLIELGLT